MEENLKNEVADQIVNLNKQKQVFWWQKSEISLNCSSFLHYYITKMHYMYHTVVITAALLKNEIYIYICSFLLDLLLNHFKAETLQRER